MAQLNSVVTASSLKSNDGQVAEYMIKKELFLAVSFVIRNRSTKRRSQLYHDLGDNLLKKLHVKAPNHPKAHRTRLICKFDENLTDFQNIRQYRELIKQSFGPKCRYCVQAYRRTVELV